MRERARKLLVCEISEVMGETKRAAEGRVDKALKGQKENKGTRRKAGRDWPKIGCHREVL